MERTGCPHKAIGVKKTLQNFFCKVFFVYWFCL